MVDIVAPLVRATMSTRQTTGFVESLLCLIGLDRDVPDFSTLSRRQKSLKVNIPYRGSGGPLHLLIDSTGIKVEGEGEWSEADQKTVRGTVFPPNAQAWRSQARSPLSLGPMARHGSPGARFISRSTRKHWRFGLLKSPAAMSAMSSR